MNLLNSPLDTPAYRRGVQMALIDITVIIAIFISLPALTNTSGGYLLDRVLAMRKSKDPQLSSQIDINVPYSTSIKTVANREGINPLILIAIIEIESNWDPDAISYAGAEGLTQTMPFIQRAYNCGVVLGNPAESISCGGHFLGDLVHKYGDTKIELAIAAYHAGEPLVDGCMCIPRPIDAEYVRRWKAAYGKHSATSWININNAEGISSATFVIPYRQAYVVTNYSPHFGGWGNAMYGIDVSTGPEMGATVYSPISGQVNFKGFDEWGNTVLHIINERCEVALLHGDYRFIKKGDSVTAGVTPVGTEASIGNSTGPHTHLSYACEGEMKNPLTSTFSQN
jgi:soluble lytic murein transglycosylase-like protein